VTARHVLFIAPVVPQRTGGGISMRAWYVLRALAASCTVHLVVGGRGDLGALADADLPVASRMAVPVRPPRRSAWLMRQMLSLGIPRAWARGSWLPEWPVCTDARDGQLQRFLQGKTIDVVHVHRLYMMPLAECVQRYLTDVPLQLDVDDLEAETHARFAALRRHRGEWRHANLEAATTHVYERLTPQYLERADALWVCSSGDAATLRQHCGSTPVMVVPNTAAAPAGMTARPDGQPFTFLFVGTLGYLPNHAGVDWLLREVLPHLRRIAPSPFVVRIVGRASPRQRRWRAVAPELQLTGFVPELASHYAAAHAVLVPIHAGGGTRIKALEAFAHRRAVVTTSLGVEGLDTTAGEHVLMADDAHTFADRCAQLMREPGLADRLAARAWELYGRRFSPEVMAQAVQAATDSIPSAKPGRGWPASSTST
jgi:glycosyltransferase involved in cell wall biosynthesis